MVQDYVLMMAASSNIQTQGAAHQSGQREPEGRVKLKRCSHPDEDGERSVNDKAGGSRAIRVKIRLVF